MTQNLAPTRESLHRVAEHVLSAARRAATGRIGLRAAPGGFATPPFGDGQVVAVQGTDLVVLDRDGERRAPLTTLAAAAELAGVPPPEPGAQPPPATRWEPDAELTLDPDAAQALADWFALGAEALRTLADRYPQDRPSPAQLWPEHFDLGITADAVNYGASPGDARVDTPYLYIGPHEGRPDADAFWNAPFGAIRTAHQISDPADAVAFFVAGRDRVTRARRAATERQAGPAGTETRSGR